MTDASGLSGEREGAGTGIVRIFAVAAVEAACVLGSTGAERGMGENCWGNWMGEFPGCLDGGGESGERRCRDLAGAGGGGGGTTEVVVLVEHDYGWEFPFLFASAAGEEIAVEAWCGDGSEVCCVALRDIDAVLGVEDVLDTIETFRGEFIVCKRAEEFGDEDIDVDDLVVDGGTRPAAHVGFVDEDFFIPERVGGVASLDEDVRVGVLLDCAACYGDAGRYASLQDACHKRSSPGSCDGTHDGSSISQFGAEIFQGRGHGTLIPFVFDGILFEDFVSDRFEVVG